MKIIFDFDDVLFKNTPEFKERMFSVIEQAGIPRDQAEKRYLEVRDKEFSLKNFLKELFGNEDLYEKIMSVCPDLVDKKMADLARQTGKENCY